MATIQKRPKFFETLEGQEIEEKLRLMELDVAFNTTHSYTADSMHYPDNLMPFMDKHKNYLIAHPAVNPDSYVSNLRLKTRLR